MEKLFIIEDNPYYLELIVFALKKEEYVIEVFEDAGEALNNFYPNPEIVLLDYHLEGNINGLECLKSIKSINPDVCVIFLSGQDDIKVATDALKYGAFDYIVKSDRSFSEIKDAIRRFNRLKSEIQK